MKSQRAFRQPPASCILTRHESSATFVRLFPGLRGENVSFHVQFQVAAAQAFANKFAEFVRSEVGTGQGFLVPDTLNAQCRKDTTAGIK